MTALLDVAPLTLVTAADAHKAVQDLNGDLLFPLDESGRPTAWATLQVSSQLVQDGRWLDFFTCWNARELAHAKLACDGHGPHVAEGLRFRIIGDGLKVNGSPARFGTIYGEGYEEA